MKNLAKIVLKNIQARYDLEEEELYSMWVTHLGVFNFLSDISGLVYE